MNAEIAQNFDALGAPLLKRQSVIKQQKNDATHTYSLEFLGKLRELPRFEVSIDLPIYRLANGRTRTLQREYLATHPDAPKDLFSTTDETSGENSDESSYDAQCAQHEILLKLVEEEDLFKNFKSGTLSQEEPIICTVDGVVVNGNRRLCAWRELYYSDKEKYKNFQTISIAVLPQCTEEDIEDLECKLQIQKTMRAEYHWHTIAFMAKEKIENGKPIKEVAKAYDQSPTNLQRLIDARDYAEQYLIEIGKPEQWSLVDNDEYAFIEMAKARQKLTSPGDKEFFEAIVFQLLKSGDINGRMYSNIPKIAKNIENIAKESREALDLPSQEEIVLSSNDSSDDLGLLAGEDTIHIEDTSTLADAIRTTDDVDVIQNVVQDVIDTQEQLEKEKNSKNSLLKQLSKAASLLQDAINNGISVENINTSGVSKQLDNIEKNVALIRDWLNKQNENTN